MTDTALIALRPRTVDRAFTAIGIALLAGVAEALIRAAAEFDHGNPEIGSLATDLGVRATVYLLVGGIAFRMRAGDWVARTTLAVGLCTVGLASLIIEPMAATLSANGFGELIEGVTTDSVAIALLRIVHVGAVLVAVVSMYRYDARLYFR